MRERPILNKHTEIIRGDFKGFYGDCIAIDNNKIKIELQSGDTLETLIDNVIQDIDLINKVCTCGTVYTIKDNENDGNNYCHFCNERF